MKSSKCIPATVAVVVPTYNRTSLVGRCLDSIYAQKYRPLRVILVDNNSTDDTLQSVEKWKDAHSSDSDFRLDIVSEDRQGATYARQKGLAIVDEEVVVFFDSDDEMRPDLLSRAMDEFRKNPQLDLVGWPVLFHHLDGKKRQTHRWSRVDREEKHLIHGVYRTQGYATRTSFMRRIGGWSKDIPVWNDWELGVRILINYPNEVNLSTPKVDVYSQVESITGTGFASKAGKWEETIDIVESEIESSSHPARERMLRLLDYRRVILAALYAAEGHGELALPLLRKTLSSSRLNLKHRLILRLCYGYTRRGGRGAFTLLGKYL